MLFVCVTYEVGSEHLGQFYARYLNVPGVKVYSSHQRSSCGIISILKTVSMATGRELLDRLSAIFIITQI